MWWIRKQNHLAYFREWSCWSWIIRRFGKATIFWTSLLWHLTPSKTTERIFSFSNVITYYQWKTFNWLCKRTMKKHVWTSPNMRKIWPQFMKILKSLKRNLNRSEFIFTKPLHNTFLILKASTIWKWNQLDYITRPWHSWSWIDGWKFQGNDFRSIGRGHRKFWKTSRRILPSQVWYPCVEKTTQIKLQENE